MKYPELEAHLLERHPWGKLEVTATPIEAGSTYYLRWIDSTVRPQPSE
ncbi:divalent cation tolerance protein CutA [Streptomyces durbertensis]